jgi:hypothetical protein
VANVDVTGNIGGLAAADAECGNGEKALLSTDSISANARVDIKGPVVNTSGKKVADGLRDLFDGSLDAAISGRKRLVWTGSNQRGDPTRDDCEEWTSPDRADNATFGRSTDTDEKWVDTGSEFRCNATLNLYCLDGQ